MKFPEKSLVDMSDEEIESWHNKIKQYNEELATEYEKWQSHLRESVLGLTDSKL